MMQFTQYLRYSFFCLFLVAVNLLSGQQSCPSVFVPDDTLLCSNQTTLNATVVQNAQTTNYTVAPIPYVPFPFVGANNVIVNVDDIWSGVIQLPFDFCFYGTGYNQCIIGANGIISFDVANAGLFCQWAINAPIPSNANPTNSIMSPFHDIDPSVSGQVTWDLYGTYPCRIMVITWNQVAMFSCNNLITTQQTVLYETTNIIETYILNKPLCATWNGGAGIHGIQDATGTVATVVPGRNFPTNWAAQNDAWRFTPAGGASNVLVNWYQGGVLIGTGTSINITPGQTDDYVAEAIYSGCAGAPDVTVYDTATITVQGDISIASSTFTDVDCNGTLGTASVTIQNNSGGTAVYSWVPNVSSTASATGLNIGTYTVYVSSANSVCVASQTFNIGLTGSVTINNVTTTNANCNGTLGSANVSAQLSAGGLLSYSWLPNVGNSAIVGSLNPGNYTVYAISPNGLCQDSASFTIGGVPPIVVNGSSIPVSCHGGNDGSIAVSASGGTAPYSYNWFPAVSNTAVANGLSAGTYTLVVSDVNNCNTPQTFVVTEPPYIAPPIAEFTYPDSICAGDANQVVYVSQPAGSYVWNFGDAVVISGTGAGPYSLSWTNGGIHTVCLEVTSLDPCLPPSSICHDILVLDRPVADIAPVANQCLAGNSFGFTYAGTTNIDAYYWGFPGGFPAYASVANPTGISYTSAGTYTAWCYVVKDGCVSDTAYTTFQVIADPSATFQISGVPFCLGACTELTYTGTPVSTQQTYSWTLPGTSSPVNSTLPNLPCVVFSGLGQNQITLTVDNFGCIASTTQEIYILPSPQADAGIDRAFCEGTGPIQLFDSVTNGTPTYLYSWWSNPAATGGITDPYVNNPFVNPTDSGTVYYFQVQDMMGCKSNIDSAIVSIYDLPIAYAGPDKLICEHPGAFPVVLNGQILNPIAAPGPYQVQWTPTTGMLQGQDTLWEPTVHPATTTIYYLKITDAHGCSNVVSILDTMSTVTVNVNPLPIVEAGPTQHICFGTTTQLLGFAQGSNNYTYNWTPAIAPGNVAQPNNPTSNATPNATTTYTLSVTAEGCTNTDTVTVVVHTLPTAAIEPAVADICQGDNILLTGLANGDPTGVSYQYSWTPATGLSNPLIATPIASPTSTTTYNLYIKSPYCTGFADAITIGVRPTPIVSIINQDSTICAGEDMKLISVYTFNGTPVFQPVLIQWTPALTCSNPTDSITFVQPTQTTVYTVQASAAGACPTTATVKVEVAPKPNATISAPITTLCEGETAILTANGGFSSSTYSWSPNTALNNTTSQQVTCNGAGLDSLGIPPYTYTVWIQEGLCTDSASVAITAYPLPIADYVMSNKNGCVPFTVVFGENATGETQYLWNFGDGSPVSNMPNPSHTFTSAGDYVVTFTAMGLGGCDAAINSAVISVSDGAIVDFSSNPTETDTLQIPNTEVIFTDMSQQAVSWQWEFGDGLISSEQNPTHYFVNPGTYTVTLTAVNTHGCTGQTAKSYTVTNPDLFIPNLFTPNGDGYYDEWNVQYNGKEPISIVVFDRWGVEVFNTKSLEKGWDGTNTKGKRYSEGIYFYTLKVSDHVYNGNITLMR